MPKKSNNHKTRSEVVTKAFINATTFLELTPLEISNLIGISPASWSRIINHKRLIEVDKTKEAEFAVLLIRIYRSLDALFGGNNKRSQEWLRAYNHHLNGIPIALIQKAEGLVNVAAYLEYAHQNLLKPKQSFIDFMRSSPLAKAKLNLKRDKSLTRDVHI